jgi:hypothetical protein
MVTYEFYSSHVFLELEIFIIGLMKNVKIWREKGYVLWFLDRSVFLRKRFRNLKHCNVFIRSSSSSSIVIAFYSYYEAATHIQDRSNKMQDVVSELLGKNLELLGLTGVEDRLQVCIYMCIDR